MAKKELYKLRDRDTMYFDRESGFTITGDEEKPLPKTPSHALRMRVLKGALIRVEKKAPEKEPEQTDAGADNTEQKADD